VFRSPIFTAQPDNFLATDDAPVRQRERGVFFSSADEPRQSPMRVRETRAEEGGMSTGLCMFSRSAAAGLDRWTRPLALHDRLLASRGGAADLRDESLLQSALARPRRRLAGAESPDIVGLAAVYTAGIVRNYPL
jgi:hypothetical protein